MAVGPQYTQDNSTPASGRQSKDGSAVVTQSHGKYYEPASRGVLFVAGDQGAGVALQTSITTTGFFSLSNPAGSGKRLAIKKVSVAYFSGTLAAGPIYHAQNGLGTTQPSSGTTLTAYPLDVGNISGVAAVGVARTGPTMVVASTAVLYPLGSITPILATSANDPFLLTEDVDGAIVIEPGCSYLLVSVLGSGSSTPKCSVGVIWEEIPIVQSQG